MSNSIKKRITKEISLAKAKFIKKQSKNNKNRVDSIVKIKEIKIPYAKIFKDDSLSFSELNSILFSLELGDTASVYLNKSEILIELELGYYPLGIKAKQIKTYIKCSDKIAFSVIEYLNSDDNLTQHTANQFLLDLVGHSVSPKKISHILEEIIGVVKVEGSSVKKVRKVMFG